MALVSSRANFHPQMIHPNPGLDFIHMLEPAGPADRGRGNTEELCSTALRARLWRCLPWRSVPRASPVMRRCRDWTVDIASRSAYEERSSSLEGFPDSALPKNQTPDLSVQGLTFGAHDFLTATFRTIWGLHGNWTHSDQGWNEMMWIVTYSAGCTNYIHPSNMPW